MVRDVDATPETFWQWLDEGRNKSRILGAVESGDHEQVIQEMAHVFDLGAEAAREYG